MDCATIELTPNECLVLSDALSATAPPLSLEPEPPYDLILKIGGAFLQTRPPETRPVAVSFTKAELFRLREYAKSGIAVGPEKVGLSLAVKVYAALRAVTADADIHAAVTRIGETSAQEPGRDALKDRLAAWRKDNEKGGDRDA